LITTDIAQVDYSLAVVINWDGQYRPKHQKLFSV